MPGGTYHLELETTLPDRSSNAAELFATLLQELEDERTEVV